MKRKDITIEDYHNDWLDKHPNYNLSEEVRNMLDNEMRSGKWATDPIQHTPGIQLGTHALTQNNITYNRFDSPFDANWVITGGIGNGKTTGSLIHLDQYLTNSEVETPLIITIDMLNATEALTEKHNGEKHEITNDTGLNPLQVTPHQNPSANPNAIPEKLKLIKGFFNVFLDETNQQLTTAEWNLLSDALKTIYEQKGIQLNDPETYDNPSPTIRDDVIPLITKIANGVHTPAKSRKQQDRKTATQLLLKLDEIRVTTDSDTHGRFTGKTDLQFDVSPSTDVLQLDLTHIPSTARHVPALYTTLMTTFDWATAIDRNVILYVDEARHLLDSFETKEPLDHILRDARHQHISMQLAFQNAEQFTETDHFKTIWNLCSHKLMYRDETINSVPNNAIGMKNAHKQYVMHAKPGSQETGYSEAALQLPNMEWQPIRVHTAADSQNEIL